MHIEQVHLHRFKQFKSAKIELHQGLSLLVGGNNAGKSSILHALAVWEFCKTILEFVKGRKSWTIGGGSQGTGVAISEFSPMSVPSLKHLWTNLKTNQDGEPDGYTLKIRADWSLEDGTKRHLEFGLSLTNDRLFIKTTSTNLDKAEVVDADGKPIANVVPNVAYLPPFAGMTDRESRNSVATRNRLIGQGLSGGVIRNVLYDMWEHNKKERVRLRGAKSKINGKDLANLRANDPWEVLLSTLGKLFSMGLTVGEFDDRYHTHLRIETYKGKWAGYAIQKHPNYTPRDLMVEGSGFLQWLSVYALGLAPRIDVLLLDEPDAHLHTTLQQELVERLAKLALDRNKQVLMATHSSELIKGRDHKSIIQVANAKARYLEKAEQKVAVLAGIGTAYAPKLHTLVETKRLLIIEGSFDEKILRIWADIAGIDWPENLVVWHWTGGHKERRQLFSQLKTDIPEVKAISLRDRDDEADATVDNDLLDKNNPTTGDGFTAYKWRRRHAENYLLVPSAIARAAGKEEDAIRNFFAGEHGLAIPGDTTPSAVVMPIRDARGKELMSEWPNSIEAKFSVSREDVAKALLLEELAEDVQTMLGAIRFFADH